MPTAGDPIPAPRPWPSLEVYRHGFSLDRLRFGIDNLRHDVRISPRLAAAAGRMTTHLIAKMSGGASLPEIESDFNWRREERQFTELCRTLLEDAVNRAKVEGEPQVLYLALTATASLFEDALEERYNRSLESVKHLIWRLEVNYRHEESVRLKDDLLRLTRQRERIFAGVRRRLYRHLSDALREGVNDLFAIHFGEERILPDGFFENPLLQQDDPAPAKFMIREYALIGHRQEDIHRYEVFLEALRAVLERVADKTAPGAPPAEIRSGEDMEEGTVPDGALQCEANIERLFGAWDPTREVGGGEAARGERKKAAALREWRLAALHREFRTRELLPIVLTASFLPDLCRTYVPPLTAHDVLFYLVDRRGRRAIRTKLKQARKSFGESVHLKPLREAAARIRRIRKKERTDLLVRFLGRFCRYHRDYSDLRRFQAAKEGLHLLRDEKDLELSRANGSLFDFLLPEERSAEDAPVVGHVVLKADVRGSTGIVREMKSQGLNPATNFSRHFFDPISEILPRYGAHKVFIEGDATILSISEKEDRPDQWYCVARSCGLAMAILLIVRRYNRKNRENDLPHLETGIGISYAASAPTYFFDGDNRIMISPAINQADRLSSCFKSIRRRFATLKPPFNVYVFEPVPEDRALVPEPLVRYNVGGIELNGEGFEKLKREIQLTPVELSLPNLQREPVRIHFGRFPTLSGRQQPLIVREAPIPRISLKDMRMHGTSPGRYYEVCTHPLVYESVRSRLG